MNLFQMQLLYFVGVTGTVLTVCLYSGSALLGASRKRLKHVQVWLLPIFVGNLLNVPSLVIQEHRFFTGTRATMPEYSLMLILPEAAGCLFLYGMARLLRVIRDTPAAKQEAFAGVQPDPEENYSWPPPPNDT